MEKHEKKYCDKVRDTVENAKKQIEKLCLEYYTHTDFTRQITENAIFALISAEYGLEAYKNIYEQIE